MNLGFAAGHNLLLEQAFSDGAGSVLVINPDLILHPEAVDRLLSTEHPALPNALVSGVLLLSGRIPRQGQPSVIDSRGTIWTATSRHLDENHGELLSNVRMTGTVRETAALTGALMLVSRPAYTTIRIGSGEFFDEDFFAYREDAELGLRAALLNVPSLVLDEPVGTHFRGSPGTARSNATANRFGVRNRFLIAFKYGFRGRPGRPFLSLGRDLVAIVACLTVERSSLGGLGEAWRLRHAMRLKRARLSAHLRER